MKSTGKNYKPLFQALIYLGIAVVSFIIGMLFIWYGDDTKPAIDFFQRIFIGISSMFFLGGVLMFLLSFLPNRLKAVYIYGQQLKGLGAIKTKSKLTNIESAKSEFANRLLSQNFVKSNEFEDTYYRGREIVTLSYTADMNDPFILRTKLETINNKLLKEKNAQLTGLFSILNILLVENAPDDFIIYIPQQNGQIALDAQTISRFCVYDTNEATIYFEFDNVVKKTIGRNNAYMQQQQQQLLPLIFAVSGYKNLIQSNAANAANTERILLKDRKRAETLSQKEAYKLKQKPVSRLLYNLSFCYFFLFLIATGVCIIGVLTDGESKPTDLFIYVPIFGGIALLFLAFTLMLYKGVKISDKGLSVVKAFRKKKFISCSDLKYSVHYQKHGLKKSINGNLSPAFALYSDYDMKEDEICHGSNKNYILVNKSEYNREILERMRVPQKKFDTKIVAENCFQPPNR